MKLVIGGYAQGKLDYVLDGNRLTNFCIVDGELPNAEQLKDEKNNGKTVIVNHFHEWMRASIRQGKNAEQEIPEFFLFVLCIPVQNCPEAQFHFQSHH